MREWFVESAQQVRWSAAMDRRKTVGGVMEAGDEPAERSVELVVEGRPRFVADDIRGQGERSWAFGCGEHSDEGAIDEWFYLWDQ